MKQIKTLLCAAVIGVSGSANALVIDFTDEAWGSGLVQSPTTVTYGDLDVTLTSNPSQYTAKETCEDTFNLGLACDHDGIGIKDDEITWTEGNYTNGEYLTVDFNEGVDIDEVYLLDLFPDEPSGSEVAQMRSENSQGDVTWAVWQADTHNQWGWYIGTEDNDLKGTGGFFDDVTSLVFFSDEGGTWTDIHDSDFALAGIKLADPTTSSSVPEPGTIGLLTLGLAGLFGARRNQK